MILDISFQLSWTTKMQTMTMITKDILNQKSCKIFNTSWLHGSKYEKRKQTYKINVLYIHRTTKSILGNQLIRTYPKWSRKSIFKTSLRAPIKPGNQLINKVSFANQLNNTVLDWDDTSCGNGLLLTSHLELG